VTASLPDPLQEIVRFVGRAIPDLPDLQWLTTPGPVASGVAAASFIGLVAGTAGTIGNGGWPWRTLLVASSLVWPFPDHVFQGPVLVTVSYLHGVHAADMLSVVGLAIALAWPRRRRARARGRVSPGRATGR
jgi:hypothetical protein